MTPSQRGLIGGMALSVLALAGIYNREGFTAAAVIPVPGDVPTIGHGTTVYPDGSRVKLGDTITRQRADEIAQKQISTSTSRVSSAVRLMYRCSSGSTTQLSISATTSAFRRSAGRASSRNSETEIIQGDARRSRRSSISKGRIARSRPTNAAASRKIGSACIKCAWGCDGKQTTRSGDRLSTRFQREASASRRQRVRPCLVLPIGLRTVAQTGA